ncbi:MAG: esterase/lipase [Planctomycetota bacterium]
MKYLRAILKQIALALVHITIGAVLVGAWFYVDAAQGQADLCPWHTVELDSEYTGEDDERVTDYSSYVALEHELFAELDREIDNGGHPTTRLEWSRFNESGVFELTENALRWNRSVELSVPSPVGGAVLLHGATDSPYSMRALAEELYSRGWHVIVPRYQGHGTAPSGLMTFEWEALAKVVDMATVHLRKQIGPDLPLVAVGYSTGGALALEHELSIMEGEPGEPFDQIVNLSPAIGLTPAAALASTLRTCAKLFGIPKLAWTNIEPEYDPFKYNSFSLNAGDQVYMLSERINARLDRLADSTGIVKGLPPILSFVSVLDATVRTPETIRFYDRLDAEGGHELVIFDVNRTQKSDDFLRPSNLPVLARIPARSDRAYKLSVLSNLSDTSTELAEWNDVPSREGATRVALGLNWPMGVYSLSHVALSIRMDDAVYGLAPRGDPDESSIGNLQARGEHGLFVISTDNLMRMRCNPFFDFLADRTAGTLQRLTGK